MKIEFTRAEIERIILDHIRNEIAPYLTFKVVYGALPEILTVETKNAAQ